MQGCQVDIHKLLAKRIAAIAVEMPWMGTGKSSHVEMDARALVGKVWAVLPAKTFDIVQDGQWERIRTLLEC